MRRWPEVPAPAAVRSPESAELAALKTQQWRTQQELHALLDTVAVYRQAASALAQENLELRDALARAELRARTWS
jgi:hypothetical protein